MTLLTLALSIKYSMTVSSILLWRMISSMAMSNSRSALYSALPKTTGISLSNFCWVAKICIDDKTNYSTPFLTFKAKNGYFKKIFSP